MQTHNTIPEQMTEKVQYWQNGLMMGLMRKDDAIEYINQGTYRQINSQAIEYIGGGV